MLSDSEDINICRDEIAPLLEKKKDRISLIILTINNECRNIIRKIEAQFLIVSISYITGNTCEDRILTFGMNPSALEFSFNIIFGRRYKKIVIIGGDKSIESHKNYAITYFNYLCKDVIYIGDLIDRSGFLSIVQLIKMRNPEGGVILYFSYMQLLPELMKTFADELMFDHKYHVITYTYMIDINPYNYEAVSNYFPSINTKENQEFLKYITLRIGWPTFLGDKILVINNVVNTKFELLIDVHVERCCEGNKNNKLQRYIDISQIC